MRPAAREPLSPLVTDNFAPERKELVWDSMYSVVLYITSIVNIHLATVRTPYGSHRFGVEPY